MLPSTVLTVDPAGRQELLDRLAQAGQIVLDDHAGAQQHLIVLVDRVQAGRAGALAEQIDDARRLRLHVGDLGIGDEHGGRRARQADHPALVQLDGEAAFGRDRLGGALAAAGARQQADRRTRPRVEVADAAWRSRAARRRRQMCAGSFTWIPAGPLTSSVLLPRSTSRRDDSRPVWRTCETSLSQVMLSALAGWAWSAS